MPLKKVEKGNMYDWCTHTHSHLGGECLHRCSYCYVQRNRFGVSPRYKGELRLIENELNVDYGNGKVIFIEHMNDLFSNAVFADRILEHCKKYPNNIYVIQTKNPKLAFHYFEVGSFPKQFIIGTTIETDDNKILEKISKAPHPADRFIGLELFIQKGCNTFLTIEPILNFNLDFFSKIIIEARPGFVNIGADSKFCNLPEPSKEKILKLIEILKENNIEIRQKSNLARLLK